MKDRPRDERGGGMRLWRDDNPKLKARTAGACYLLAVVAVFPGQLLAIDLVASGDAAATLNNIRANEQNVRLAFAATILSLAASIGASVVLYSLLAPVSKTASVLAVAFNLISVVISAGSELLRLSPAFVDDDPVAFSMVQVAGQGSVLALVFYGFGLIMIGLPVLRSLFFPQWLGALLLIAGGAYLGWGFITFVNPDWLLSLPPYLRQPSFGIGDPIIIIWMLWLLAVGLHGSKWNEQKVR